MEQIRLDIPEMIEITKTQDFFIKLGNGTEIKTGLSDVLTIKNNNNAVITVHKINSVKMIQRGNQYGMKLNLTYTARISKESYTSKPKLQRIK